MVRGGIAVLDEGNRMPERAWASLAPLLDESEIAATRDRATRTIAAAQFPHDPTGRRYPWPMV